MNKANYIISVAKLVNYDSKKWFEDSTYRINIIKQEEDSIQPYLDIFNKYHLQYTMFDTLPGAFNLNRNWVETEPFEAEITWGYVKPLGWSKKDFNVFYNAERNGDLIIRVNIFDENNNFLYSNQ